jgi:hypothetical protein
VVDFGITNVRSNERVSAVLTRLSHDKLHPAGNTGISLQTAIRLLFKLLLSNYPAFFTFAAT